jgi:hypothetical protein
MTEEDEAFNEIERKSKAKKAAVESSVNAKEALTKLLIESYDQGVKDALEVARDATIEEVAQHLEKLKLVTADALANFIREMKQ